MMMPSERRHEAPDDQLLVRYLLGSLPQDDVERFDELSIVDDEFAERLNAVEHDLVDAYARGELSGDELDRFRAQYLSSPVGREKIRFAEALLTRETHAASQARSKSLQSKAPWWSILTPHWAAAAFAVLLLAAGYLLVDDLRLRRRMIESDAVQADLRQREQRLQQQLEGRSAERDQPIPRDRKEEAASRESAPEARSVPGTGLVVSVMLEPITRGAGTVTPVTVPAETTVADLRLELDSDDFPAYLAVLTDPSTREVVWRSGSLKKTAGNIVSVKVPAALLRSQTYSLELLGSPRSGSPQLADSYVFRAVR
jgi:hypothetical protein